MANSEIVIDLMLSVLWLTAFCLGVNFKNIRLGGRKVIHVVKCIVTPKIFHTSFIVYECKTTCMSFALENNYTYVGT